MPTSPACIILAEHPSGGERRETRILAASAMVLADRWTEQGCSGVRLTDPAGVTRARSDFRTALLHQRRSGQR